jgi:pentatricopeptide repeat protein
MEMMVTSALIEMYGKCGRMRDAQQVFDTRRSRRGLMEWTSLISGYARNGESGAVFEVFEKMKCEEGGLLWLDEVTFLGVLSACCHGGLVEDGRRYFDSMASYGITPSIEHYNCMIDLLGRAGRLEEMVLMLESMPFQPDAVAWSTLLDACRRWGHVDLGGHAFASMSEKSASGSFVLMSNLYVENADAR